MSKAQENDGVFSDLLYCRRLKLHRQAAAHHVATRSQHISRQNSVCERFDFQKSVGSRRCKLKATLILRQRVCGCLHLPSVCSTACATDNVGATLQSLQRREPRRLPACLSVSYCWCWRWRRRYPDRMRLTVRCCKHPRRPASLRRWPDEPLRRRLSFSPSATTHVISQSVRHIAA